MDNEISFFEHIGAKIAILAKAYKNASEDLQEFTEKISAAKKNDKSNINYTIILNRLNASINDFKREMKRSLQDYYMIMNINPISHNAAKHIESKLEDLHDEYTRFNKSIPEDIIKKGLGKNYYFHKNMKKLTVEILLDYFETNYLLHMEDEKK